MCVFERACARVKGRVSEAARDYMELLTAQLNIVKILISTEQARIKKQGREREPFAISYQSADYHQERD